MPRATRNAIRLSSGTRRFARHVRPVLKLSIPLLSFMRIDSRMVLLLRESCKQSIGGRGRTSVTAEFAGCNSFVTYVDRYARSTFVLRGDDALHGQYFNNTMT